MRTVITLFVLLMMDPAHSPAGAQFILNADVARLRTEVVARGLVHPWALAFLPDGRMLVTERPGRMRVVDAKGRLSAPISGLPDVAVAGQCGLLDLLPDTDPARNGWLYWSYAEPAGAASGAGATGETGNSTAVARGKLEGLKMVQVQRLFSQRPKTSSSLHCGSRLALDGEGHLYIGLGDRFGLKEQAQDLSNHIGKTVRIHTDGRVPASNPFTAAGQAREVWSLGHRNIQGLVFDSATRTLWASEHGPQGGDEINRINQAANHGWPLLTFGRNYGSGTAIGEPGPKTGFVQPQWHWAPVSVGPSGLAVLRSQRYPATWQGALLVGSLRAQVLHLLTVQDGRITGAHTLLNNLGQRIRDVRMGPDGWIYLVTDGAEGQVLRVVMAAAR